MSSSFQDPPTEISLADARRTLSSSRSSVAELDAKIETAEAALAQVVRDSKSLIHEMQTERAMLEERALTAMAYLSPIRRLPTEMLRDIFLRSFEAHPCCAWVLAAIRLLTTQQASADTIRLWLERSGDTVPLDIEIFLHVTSKGDAPLLREFEVSSAEAAFYPEWQWLPNAPSNATLVLPKLDTLTLQYTPFKWSSPMLRTNLHTLNLRALPTSHHPLDRILHIIANNTSLESLTLHFQGVLPAVLPLTPTTLPHLKRLGIGGHHILTQLVDILNLPMLVDLELDIETRDQPIEDTISALLVRSSAPTLTHLSIAYGPTANHNSFYYGPTGVLIAWPSLLADLSSLQSLHVGGTPLEPLLAALGVPDDDTNQMSAWGCPKLEVLGMRNCHAHSEGVIKLVQMVEARNPKLGSGGGSQLVSGITPTRLKSLEMYDCASLGEDVVEWLQCRIGEVVCTEPDFAR
ncbi:hypothetical protein DXG03_001647 [Asterophora parasitica]|uniref:F-box domain-containing protein n=1 Tax=Asterophora parasitica TaxID=117018 RepID=A0A9P7KBL9_9AGAR|nr:hypothetical protein DXG03_001647 [Asterophora parasitica]